MFATANLGICLGWTLVWTHTPDILHGFAANITGPGHSHLLRVYGYFWFIFVSGNRFHDQNLNLELRGVFMEGGGMFPSH